MLSLSAFDKPFRKRFGDFDGQRDKRILIKIIGE